ncbi:MAG TPA: hypothetical protein VGB56_05715 [Flavisolibacter sp.]
MKRIITTILAFTLTLTVFAQKRAPQTREEQLNQRYTSGLFSTPDGVYFDLEGDDNASSAVSYLNVLDWLQGRVAGLQIYNFQGRRIPVIRNQRASIYVDEMRVDADFLNALPVTDIAMIKVIKSPFFGGWGGGGGAIAVYTKDGDEEED